MKKLIRKGVCVCVCLCMQRVICVFLMQRGEHVGQALCNLGNSVETFLTESMSDCLSLSGFFFQAIHTHICT